ncbi:MAG: allantoate amidohydrolase [Terriglobia bacterium]|nr:MAG: allantoate amidohydrolase [Terriglobia bacterium]
MENEIIRRCRAIAACTEEPGFTTRTFLCPAMREVHALLCGWMEQAGMSVRVDAAGNLRGCYAACAPGAPRLYIGSHLDTVPHAGAFDGVLGVVLGVALVEMLAGRRLKFEIEVLGFSEEEGVCFGMPFIGSRAFIGDPILDPAVKDAIREFGLDPSLLAEAHSADDVLGYLEFHIEQGPILESLALPLGIVEAIAGQSRLQVQFQGAANHAGTTPMNLRRDALAAAAEWIGAVEREARGVAGLTATVGRLEVEPGASNVIPGRALATLDVRHAEDAVRRRSVDRLVTCAEETGRRRGLSVTSRNQLDQSTVPMDTSLVGMLECAVTLAGFPLHRMTSGAGHDAMIVARRIPAAMLFLRSPGGISHHPEESVLAEDVAAALKVGAQFLEEVHARLV